MAPTPTKPLAGLRVLELARILAGPWAGQLLADMGADVIKVERPGEGDDTRHWGPPFLPGTQPADGASSYFESANRGKRSVALDLANADDLARIKSLADDADVLIENFKVGALARHGLDQATLRARNPRLVYCSITGFGQTGPYASRAGYDFLVQGMGGAMALTGEPDGEPMKSAVAYADVFTGLYASNAILAALHAREHAGVGCHIDTALLDTQVAVLGNQAMHYLVSGGVPPRLGNAHSAIVPYQVFGVADGHVIVACGNDEQFRRFCGVLGADWCDDPRFSTNPARVRERGRLVPLIATRMESWTRSELLAALEAAAVPAGPINDLTEVFADPQVVHRGMVRAKPPHLAGTAPTPALCSPIVIDGVRQVADGPAPTLGQHDRALTRSWLGDEAQKRSRPETASS